MRPLVAFPVALAIVLAGAPPAFAAWLWPVNGEVITPYRNGGDPYAAGMHRGIDIAAPLGTPVLAAEGGTVTFAGVAGSSGLTVAVDTGSLTTSYLHLSSAAVRRGGSVNAGDPLGAVGASGSNRSAAAPHLHFGVRETGTAHGYRDPLALLAPRPAPREAPPAEPVGAPAAVPLPVAPKAVPVPVHAPDPPPEPAPVPGPPPEPVRVPIERPLPVAPPPAPRAQPVAAGGRAPRNHRPHRAARARAPGHGPSGEHPHRSRAPERPARVPEARPPHRGALPWAAACAGLLLAGGAMGLGRSARRPASSIDRPCPTTSRRPSTT